MKHDTSPDAMRTDDLDYYIPAMPNTSGKSGYLTRVVGRLFRRD